MEIFLVMMYSIFGLIVILFISIISCNFCKGAAKEPPPKEPPPVIEQPKSARLPSVHTGNTSKTCQTVDVFELGEKSSILVSAGDSANVQKRSFNVSITKSSRTKSSKDSKKSVVNKSITKGTTSKSGKETVNKEAKSKKSSKEAKKSSKIRMKRGDPGLTAPIRPN